MLTYEQIKERLEAIESDLGERQVEFEQVADERSRLERTYEVRLARVKLQTNADTETAKKDRALDAIAASDDGLFERYANAEARYNALKSAVRVLEMRATIGMALLKSWSREPGAEGSSGQTYGGR